MMNHIKVELFAAIYTTGLVNNCPVESGARCPRGIRHFFYFGVTMIQSMPAIVFYRYCQTIYLYAMKRNILLLIFFFTAKLLSAQTNKDEKEITDLLNRQTISWNKGNLDEFMSGYWQNDSLMFVGKDGITYGYTNALNNYKKNYDSPAKKGKLFFEIIKVKKLSAEYYWVLGKYFLKRTAGDTGGNYTLLFRKINGKWMIIADHSS